MDAQARQARVVIAIAAALLLAYVLIWAQLQTPGIDRSDFTSSYAAGVLLRHPGGAAVYDAAKQTALRDRLIAPVSNGAVPFVDAPPAAVLVAPVTLLSLAWAYRVWTVCSLLILVLAVVVAVRSAPWSPTAGRSWRIAAGFAAIGSMGTWTLLLQGQWGSLTALGLALAYRDWRLGNQFRGALILVIAAGIAKPHLALGLAVFMLGWGRRRVLLGAAAGAGTLAAASLAAVGTAGVIAFAGLATAQGGAWDLRRMLSFIAIPGSIAGNGTISEVIGLTGTAAACLVAWRLGRLARRRPARLASALIAAAVVSLVGAPHAYAQDLVMLAPAVVWGVAVARDRGTAVLALWAIITVAAFIDFVDGGTFPPGQLAPWALLLAAVLACLHAWRPGISDPDRVPPAPTRPAAAAVG